MSLKNSTNLANSIPSLSKFSRAFSFVVLYAARARQASPSAATATATAIPMLVDAAAPMGAGELITGQGSVLVHEGSCWG